MITTYKQSLDKILEEERKSKESLASAEVEKEDILTKEREKIRRELKEYEDEMKQFYKDEVSIVITNEAKQDETVKKINMEKTKISHDCEINKSNVIDFILDRVLDVEMVIPEVVKGQFSQKLETKMR